MKKDKTTKPIEGIETTIRYYNYQGCNYWSDQYSYCLTLERALKEIAEFFECKVKDLEIDQLDPRDDDYDIGISFKDLGAVVEFRDEKSGYPAMGINLEEVKKCKQYKQY